MRGTSVHKRVKRAAQGGLDLVGFAVELALKPPADCKDGIAKGFQLQRTHCKASALMGGGQHHELVKFFEAPAIFRKPGGQIVQQGLVGGFVAAQSEIAGGADKGAPKMPVPHAVDNDPGGERVVLGCDGTC